LLLKWDLILGYIESYIESYAEDLFGLLFACTQKPALFWCFFKVLLEQIWYI